MAIQQLTDEQIRSWTRAQKDEWWFKNIFRGDMAQLSLRSGLTGFLLGGILAATALYIGAKTGIGIGVGLTSVILSFALFKVLSSAGLANDYTILENNCTQSIATAAGYAVMPMISSLSAYMLITERIIPWWQMMIWIIVVSILGVLVAFPMKRRFINEEQLPFPEGRASGVVLDSLYNGDAGEGMFKARLLGWVAGGTAAYQAIVSDGWMKLLQFKILRMDQWAGMKEPWVLHERLDTYYYQAAVKAELWLPKILGTDFRVLGLRFTLDAAMLGVGGLMGIAVATSCLLGSFLNFAVLAPLMIQAGDITQRVAPNGSLVPISRVEIVNQWSLWWAVTMMVVGALMGLLAKPEMFTSAFKSLGKKKAAAEAPGKDLLAHIEVPLWVSYIGVPIFSLLGAWVTHLFFGVPWLLALASLPLIFVLTVICTNAMALTSWTPTGALSKITQFTMGAIDRSNPASNLLPAGMTSEIASNAANLLSDIKPGYMLGGKPRHQAVGHVIGIFAGVMACVPLFYLLFLPADANGLRSTASMVTDQFAFPAALQWKGVAEIIAKGLSGLPASAITAMIIAAVSAVLIELARIVTKGRFPLSSVSIGLGVVLPPESVLAMFLGALLFWIMGRRNKAPGSKGRRIWVDGCEPICAGLISGAALMGIGNAIINVML
ncbi:putative oligopeptide transporter (OPT) family protein [Paucibacter oligotrophus]|uniref:Putative oligopeptide transporter (OPT) family protein n=1 Tax=Roseateles oligotrophus TaxID=1769250 RepID=A0A840L4F7_9BURK|nr:OPT family oligopeptide transporter [Roseateles oligotrophus]MBB4841582.1 putative oligopeptide transporter (OPT) family protein [Roseateles oligotrophus]